MENPGKAISGILYCDLQKCNLNILLVCEIPKEFSAIVFQYSPKWVFDWLSGCPTFKLLYGVFIPQLLWIIVLVIRISML
jgi:hypothetical protein